MIRGHPRLFLQLWYYKRKQDGPEVVSFPRDNTNIGQKQLKEEGLS